MGTIGLVAGAGVFLLVAQTGESVMLQMASVCHTILAYQDGAYLGEAYYSGVLMPKE